MPRQARVKGEQATYHIIMRGNEKKNIFASKEDKTRFIGTIVRMKERYNFIIEAYCVMDNHTHLIIDDNGNDISQIIKSINISYVYYYNKKYERVGHLFQDRFLSEIIMDDKYLMTVSAYIHNNPVRAGMVDKPEKYEWSSMTDYIGKKDGILMVNTYRILKMFNSDIKKAMTEYYKYVTNQKISEDTIMDIKEDKEQVKRLKGEYIENYEQAEKIVLNRLAQNSDTIDTMKKNSKLKRDLMEFLRKNSSLTLAEIGQLCGGYAGSTVSVILSKEKNRH